MVQPSEEYNIFSVFIYDLWRMRGMVEVSQIGGCNTNLGEYKGTVVGVILTQENIKGQWWV